MSKRKESGTIKAPPGPAAPGVCKEAKTAKGSFSKESLLGEICKLNGPDEIHERAVKLHDELIAEWKKENHDMTRVEILLEGAKVLLTKLEHLPLTRTGAKSKDMMIARDILEIGALYSVAKCAAEKEACTPAGLKDFERYICQLKHYYLDLKRFFPKESERIFEILGMNLLNLLSQYKIADFHRELELFIHPNVDVVLKNPYIKKAVEIEKYIMEGQYNKIYSLKEANHEDLVKAGLTSTGFKYFVDHLESTLKEHTPEIAEVIGSAYEKLSVQSTMKMLNLQDSGKMAEIIKKQNWKVKEGYIYFQTKKDNSERIPAEELMKNVLMYAEELETIV